MSRTASISSVQGVPSTGRRRSSGRHRSSASGTQKEDQDPLAAWNGLLIDYVQRQSHRKTGGPHKKSRRRGHQHHEKMPNAAQVAERTIDALCANRLIEREKLESELAFSIVRLRKKLGTHPWPKVSLGAAQRAGHRIMQLQRQASCLQAEVAHQDRVKQEGVAANGGTGENVHRKISINPLRPPTSSSIDNGYQVNARGETVCAKTERLQSFWPEFHDMARKPELGRMLSADKTKGRHVALAQSKVMPAASRTSFLVDESSQEDEQGVPPFVAQPPAKPKDAKSRPKFSRRLQNRMQSQSSKLAAILEAPRHERCMAIMAKKLRDLEAGPQTARKPRESHRGGDTVGRTPSTRSQSCRAPTKLPDLRGASGWRPSTDGEVSPSKADSDSDPDSSESDIATPVARGQGDREIQRLLLPQIARGVPSGHGATHHEEERRGNDVLVMVTGAGVPRVNGEYVMEKSGQGHHYHQIRGTAWIYKGATGWIIADTAFKGHQVLYWTRDEAGEPWTCAWETNEANARDPPPKIQRSDGIEWAVNGVLQKREVFKNPWQGEETSAHAASTPSRRYLRACEELGVLPSLMPFVTGHSPKLVAKDQVMVDADLRAVTVVIRSITILEEVDLQDNTSLSDATMVPLLDKLRTKPVSATLQRLCLKRCVLIGQATIDAVGRLLTGAEGAVNLKTLDLSGVRMDKKSQVVLCRAVGRHKNLSVVHLAETAMGDNPAVKDCITGLLQSAKLEVLDIGWNCFAGDTFAHIGRTVAEAQRLRSLRLPNCSAAVKGRGLAGTESPIAMLLENLARDKALRHLDISMNHVDFRGALVVEDAFERHASMQQLDLSHNPLGVEGLRCCLRLLSRKSSGLKLMKCEGCRSGTVASEEEMQEGQVFSTSSPGGQYNLDLSHPYHRSVLRMLYKACERMKLAPEAAFTGVKYSRQYSHPQKDPSGMWAVQTDGKLTFTFCLEGLMEAVASKATGSEFVPFLQHHAAATRMHHGFHKALALVQLFRGVSTEMQLALLDGLASDFLLPFPLLTTLCRECHMASEVLARLLPSMPAGSIEPYLTVLQVPTLEECCLLLQRLERYTSFNVENPSGHYRLDLAVAVDHSIAQQLSLLDWWEAALSMRQGRPNTSQRGDRSCVRNAYCSSCSLPARWATEWRLPTAGTLTLDYSSGRRPPPHAPAMEDECFRNLMATLQRSCCDPADRVASLRTVSHTIYVSVWQVRELLSMLRTGEARIELVVLFYFRLVDAYNEKALRARFSEHEEFSRVVKRLGYVHTFPFIQPEQKAFSLDFSDFDQRLAASLLVQLAAQEDPSESVAELSFAHPDDLFADIWEAGLPSEWKDVARITPQVGTLSAVYRPKADKRNMQCRRGLLEKFGFSAEGCDEASVRWWCRMDELPAEVLAFVGFLCARFSSAAEAFQALDGEEGKGIVGAKEFEAGVLDRLSCGKFAEEHQQEQIQTVFRYLDATGEGKISEVEWSAIEPIWQEVQETLGEFKRFCQRLFGEEWDRNFWMLDRDMHLQVPRSSWGPAVQKAGYFGPSDIIFEALDPEGRGAVTKQEFLRAFKGEQPQEAAADALRRTSTQRSSLASEADYGTPPQQSPRVAPGPSGPRPPRQS